MDKFRPRTESFKPVETFEFILKMFGPETKIMNTTINFQSLKHLPNPDSREPQLLLPQESNKAELPKILHGDNIRLKQLLINFTKNATKFTLNGVISIKAAYDA